MEIEGPLSFDSLFKDDINVGNPEILLPVIKRCLEKSENDSEILRAVEISLGCSLKNFSVSHLTGDLFHYACPMTKSILIKKLKILEGKSTLTHALESCIESLNTCLKIVGYFYTIFEHLNGNEKFTLSQIGTLLLNSSEVVFNCFFHCKISENVYGELFTSLAEHLSNFFKKCCSLQDMVLNFLTDRLICEDCDDEEWKILNKIMIIVPKSGILLINLDVKSLAKVWKSYAVLLEKYISYLKENHNIGEIINELCLNIKNSMDLLGKNEDSNKIVKLCCFLLKLIIKFCEIFNGCLRKCQKSLLNLLLLLCRCDISLNTTSDQNHIKQLTVGSDPLLSQLVRDKDFIKECGLVSKDAEQSAYFSMLCCLVLKKLMQADSGTKNLWCNKNENILEWILLAVSNGVFISQSNLLLPNVIVEGKQKKFTDLYEYVLILTSAYLMTATADEFPLIEKILMENVLQSHPVRALFAADIWCLLARFGDPELCLSQILHLSKIYQQFEEETIRVEKLYLRSLLCRLYCLLTGSQKTFFLRSFHPSFYSALWGGNKGTDFTPQESSVINSAFSAQVDQFLNQNMCSSSAFQTERSEGEMFQVLGRKIVKLWRFNCQVLSSHPLGGKFLKFASVMVAYLTTEIPSEDLFLIFCQMRKLLKMGEPACVQMYFARILNSFSTAHIPSGSYQMKILTAIADLFRDLLSSRQILVKQKTLEAFHSFSHITTHGEIITLTVQNSPQLKLEITNYFKKKLPEHMDFNHSEFISKLNQLRFQHTCQKRRNDDGRLNVKRIKSDPGDLQDVINRWKHDGETIREYFQSLTELQKREVKDLCSAIVSSF